jgi:hypothetical protein
MAEAGLTANEIQALNTAWRSLISEMGVIFAPQFLAPAETTGWNGFALGFKYGFTSLNHEADYWKYGIEGAPQPLASTVSLEVRKGIWMPLPSFELGGGFTHLVDSHMFTVNVFAKFALHEGFHHWATPALAVRGYFQRVVGTTQVDFTNLSMDVALSKSFGIAGSFNMTPYAGYNLLWIIAKSEVIDFTPTNDALQQNEWNSPLGPGAYCSVDDCSATYVFMDQDAILRHRLFVGMRFNFTVSTELRLSFSTEYSATIKGLTDDEFSQGGMSFKLTDDAEMQHTWGFLFGIDY